VIGEDHQAQDHDWDTGARHKRQGEDGSDEKEREAGKDFPSFPNHGLEGEDAAREKAVPGYGDGPEYIVAGPAKGVDTRMELMHYWY